MITKPKAPTVDRSQCRERVCTCHDDSAWRPGLYLHGCSQCGCRWATVAEDDPEAENGGDDPGVSKPRVH